MKYNPQHVGEECLYYKSDTASLMLSFPERGPYFYFYANIKRQKIYAGEMEKDGELESAIATILAVSKTPEEFLRIVEALLADEQT